MQHQKGRSKFTSHRQPIKLVHYEVYALRSDAVRRERYLKTSEGKRFLKQQLKDLYEKIHLGV